MAADLRLSGQADVADLALLLQPGVLAQLVGEAHGLVDPVQLVDRYAVEPEVVQAQLDLLAQLLRAAAGDDVRRVAAVPQPVGPSTSEHSALGRDDQVVRMVQNPEMTDFRYVPVLQTTEGALVAVAVTVGDRLHLEFPDGSTTFRRDQIQDVLNAVQRRLGDRCCCFGNARTGDLRCSAGHTELTVVEPRGRRGTV